MPIHYEPPPSGGSFTVPELKTVQGSTTSAEFVTLLDVVGPGILYAGCSEPVGVDGELKITIDNHVDTQRISGLELFAFERYASFAYALAAISVGTGSLIVYVEFQDNLKIEHRILTGTSINTKIQYGEV